MAKLPQVNSQRVIRALQRAGWYIHRTSGSHAILKPYILSKILDQADLTVEQLMELL